MSAAQYTPGPFARDAWESVVMDRHPQARVYGTYHGAVAVVSDSAACRGWRPVGQYDKLAKGMCSVAIAQAEASDPCHAELCAMYGCTGACIDAKATGSAA